MAKKPATKAEKEWMSKVASIPCMICQNPFVEIHHVRHNTGMGVRPSHYQTISLCFNHHRGAEGVHTIGVKTWESRFGSQMDMVDKTKELLCC